MEHLVRVVDAYAAGHHVNISTFSDKDYGDEEMYPDFVNLKSHEWSERGGLQGAAGGEGDAAGGGSLIGDLNRQGERSPWSCITLSSPPLTTTPHYIKVATASTVSSLRTVSHPPILPLIHPSQHITTTPHLMKVAMASTV